jgi:hypothetical protein
MPNPNEAELRAHMEDICQKLLVAGWLTEFFFHDDARGLYGIKWTPKGLERARWVNQIGDELNLGPKGLTALLAICALHAPHK